MRENYYKWDKDAVLQMASIFDTIAEFRKAYVGAYKYARRHGFLDQVRGVISRGLYQTNATGHKLKWTRERCVESAMKYDTFTQWYQGENTAYLQAWKHGHLDACKKIFNDSTANGDCYEK